MLLKGEKANHIGTYIQLNRVWLLPASLVIVVLLLFSNSLGPEFIWDDVLLVQHNYLIQNLNNLPQLLLLDTGAFVEVEGQPPRHYRPFVSLSFFTDFHLWGFSPSGYHLTNLFFHVLTVIIVYFLLIRLFNRQGLAWLSAFLFAIHPIHTEAVSWISGRADVISGFFFFLAFFLYIIRYQNIAQVQGPLKNPTGQGSDQPPQAQNIGQQAETIRLGASLLAFGLALLAKETTVTLPLVIFLYTFYVERTSNQNRVGNTMRPPLRRAVIEALPYLIIVILYLTLRLWVLGFLINSQERRIVELFSLTDLASNFLLSSKIILLYLRLLLAPFPLNANRLVSDLANETGMIAWLSPLVVLVMLSLSLMAWRRAKAYSFAGLFFLVTILPEAGWFRPGYFVAERSLYLPSLAVCLALALVGSTLWRRGQMGSSFFLLVIALPWLILTYHRNFQWRDSLTLWSQTVAVSPRSDLAHNHFGQELGYRGQYELAIAHFEQALQIDEKNAVAYNNLGDVYFAQEKYEEARENYEKAITLLPENPWGYFYLGATHERLDDPASAMVAYEQALELNPSFSPAYYQLGLLHSYHKNWTKAIFYLEQFLVLEPASAAAHNTLGLIYTEQKLFPQALSEFEQAAQLDPDSAEILANLGLAYLNTTQFKAAIRSLEQALHIDSELALAHFYLGLVYLEMGAEDKALIELAITVELDPANEIARRLIEQLAGQK